MQEENDNGVAKKTDKHTDRGTADMVTLGCLVAILLILAEGAPPQPNVCGLAPFNTRIVEGMNAPNGAWPWQASLQRYGSHFCGGSLINQNWVMTAAHCFPSSEERTKVVAYLGKHSLQGTNPYEVFRDVARIILHPDYNMFTNDNDIALLCLKRDVTYTDYISPVCLPSQKSNFPEGTECWITGWGYIASRVSLPYPGILQEAKVPLVGKTTCNVMLGPGLLTENMICAGYTQGGTDACQGDSGGPMVTKQGAVWIQAGITSWGIGCAKPNSPGVYTRVSQYESWISNVVKNNPLGIVTYNPTP